MKILSLQYGNLKNPFAFGGLPNCLHANFRHLARRHDVVCHTGLWPDRPKSFQLDGITYIQKGIGRNRYLNRLSYSLGASSQSVFEDADVITVAWDRYAPLLPVPGCTVPIILDLHANYFQAPSKLKAIEPLAIGLLKHRLKRARYITAVSEKVLEMALQYAPKLRLSRVIPGGIPDELLQRLVKDEAPVAPYFLFLGRLDMSWKGIDILLDAYRAAKVNLPLIIAGEGPDRPEIENRIRKLGAGDKISTIGWVDGDAKYRLLKNCLALCMPSRVEGYPIVAIEAGAMGKPVIGSRIVGIAEAVEDGQNGLLVTMGSRREFAHALRKIATEPTLSDELGTNAFKRVKGFGYSEIAQKKETFFQEVIDDFYST